VSVGSDFEYDLGAQRANKSFSVGGVRIASLATSYVADSAAVPPLVRVVWRELEPIAAAGIATELAQVGGRSIRGCTACFRCTKTRDQRCVITGDILNDCLARPQP